MRHYRLSTDVHVGLFDEDAVLFVAHRDLLLTVNHAAAELYEAARSTLADRPFTREDCTGFLLENFDLLPEEAAYETRSLLSFGLRNRIVLKGVYN